jgi:peptidyl-prolyl cis-trans isomerase B (cyclophilin B)
MHRVRAFAGLLLLLLGAGGCDSEPRRPAATVRTVTLAKGPHPVASLRVKDLGTIRIELLPEAAPKTVAQFEQLAGEGYFDSTTFHRVIPDFMIQGGCPNTRNADPRDDGDGGGEHVVEDEFSDLAHARGVVSMANRGSRNSGGTQFFIVHRDSHHLDGRHTVFGRVVEGMDVVDAITRLEIDKFGRYGPTDRPYPISAVVESIRVDSGGVP